MFIECPKCSLEIDVKIHRGHQGSYFEPPEPDEYDFEEEHPCAEGWSKDEQLIFDERVAEAASEPYEPDWF